MGKGARSREQNAGKKAEQQQKQLAEQKKQKRNRIVISVVSVVLVAAIAAGGLVYGFYYKSGKYLRDNVVASTENFQVDNAMMTYFFKNSYESFKAQYGQYLALTGIDATKSLKGQTGQDGKSWFDTMLENTKTGVDEMLVLAEKAKAEGLSLSESDLKAIEKRTENVNGDIYTDGVQKGDVQKALELQYLAQKYREKVNSENQYTDAELQSYYEENENKYRTAAYRSYSIPYESEEDDEASSGASQESSEASDTESSASEESTKITFTKEEAKLKAEAMKAVTSEEAFAEMVETLTRAQDSAATETDVTNAVNGTAGSAVTYVADDEVSEWAFGGNAKVGDTYMRDDESNSLYRVYYLTALPSRDESPTINVRHILFSLDNYGDDAKAKAKADEVMALVEADKSEEAFAALANEYSDDGGSNMSGGLYKAVKEGSMVEAFDAWCFDTARKPGDIDLVKTDYGYHIMYFVGKAGATWQEAVADAMRSEAFDKAYEVMKLATSVTYDDEKMQDIPG